ncbi:hypothetical protein DOTSEDRAFT_75593 [Dothistroma septosporum NZE10]|uniref:Rubisco LSMT substrate-binding domain-containing protein n=1 Tax=Dothistroma septosporum (strain NZE10 / CBS 128990) TaxID=675120 RepID=M2Y0V6_DOTSN|nr:hypothetical protein DOTSEDRAFT_75593 [Dothistroma septosporum NZE10]
MVRMICLHHVMVLVVFPLHVSCYFCLASVFLRTSLMTLGKYTIQRGIGEEILATYGAHPNDKLLVHYGFINSSEPGQPTDDDIRLDHIVLSTMPESTREALQDVGFLGGYALLPGTNELCFKTQVAIRAILLTANEWEYFIANGEDLSGDQSAKVRSWLKPRMKEYRKAAASKQEELEKLEVKDEEQEAVRLLKLRWRHIQDAVNAFLAAK